MKSSNLITIGLVWLILMTTFPADARIVREDLSFLSIPYSDATRVIRNGERNNEVIATLQKLIQDENPFIRISVAKIMLKRNIRRKEALDIIEELETYPNPEVCFEVAKVYLETGNINHGLSILGKLSKLDVTKYPFLLLKIAQAFLDYAEEEKAMDILDSLWELGNEEIVEQASVIKKAYLSLKTTSEIIAQALNERLSPQERRDAILALVSYKIYSPSEIRLVASALTEIANSPDMHTRFDLAIAFLKNPLYYDWAVDIVLKLMNDDVHRVWFTAMKVLRNWGRDYLINRIDTVKHFLTKDLEALPLELINRLKIRGKVLKEIIDKLDRGINKELIEALTYWGINHPEATQKLVEIIYDPNTSPELADFARVCLDNLEDLNQKINADLTIIRKNLGQAWLNLEHIYDISSLGIIYGFEEARIILSEVSGNKRFDINLRKKAIHLLSYERDILAMMRLLTLLETGEEEIYETLIKSLLKPWWINRSEVKSKLIPLIKKEKDLDIILTICEAYIKWGKDYNTEVIQSKLIKIAGDESLSPEIRIRAIELLGEIG